MLLFKKLRVLPKPIVFLLVVCFSMAGSLYAKEVSLVSAGIKSISSGSVDQSVIQLGGKYLEQYDSESAAFYFGLLTINNNSGEGAPADNLGLALGIGARFYGSEYTPRIRPYFSAYGEFETGESPAGDLSTTALNYGVSLGIRFDFYEKIFFELESNLFESSLMKTESSDNPKVERTYYELGFNSGNASAFDSILLAVGMGI